MTVPSGHPHRCRRLLQTGFTLVELLVFIVVVSGALAGVLKVYIEAARHGQDPLLRRQALAIAESLMEEVSLMPFTWCDGDDANVETAASSAGCASTPDIIGPEVGETRYASPSFDHVDDYDGLALNGIVDITNTPVPGLSGYRARVDVVTAALHTIGVAGGDVLRITVTVTAPDGSSLSLDGYRTRHAPNSAL